MGSYKLIALDMDGTVLNQVQQISPENQRTIQLAIQAGIHVIFATGRGIQTVQPFLEELKLTEPIVTVNGSEVWKAPGQLHRRILMDVGTIDRLHQIALQYDSWFWGYTTEGPKNRDHWVQDLQPYEWLKFGFYIENRAYRESIIQEVKSWGTLEISNSDPNNIELNPLGVNKADGVQEVCKILGIDMSQVIAMGDSMNDVSMIRAAGLGVAMGNAQEEVKRIADRVTLSNEQDGVASIIREAALKS